MSQSTLFQNGILINNILFLRKMSADQTKSFFTLKLSRWETLGTGRHIFSCAHDHTNKTGPNQGRRFSSNRKLKI